jgi:hypothetical protein
MIWYLQRRRGSDCNFGQRQRPSMCSAVAAPDNNNLGYAPADTSTPNL